MSAKILPIGILGHLESIGIGFNGLVGPYGSNLIYWDLSQTQYLVACKEDFM